MHNHNRVQTMKTTLYEENDRKEKQNISTESMMHKKPLFTDTNNKVNRGFLIPE